MDASNPIQDSTRMSISKIRDRSSVFMRQNISHLESLVKGKQRIALEVFAEAGKDPVELENLKGALKQHRQEVLHKITSIVGDETVYAEVLEKHDPIPVSSLMVDGIPIHPTGQNQKNGYVRGNLIFGGASFDVDVARIAANFLPTGEVVDLFTSTPPYTRGTKAGFQKRIAQMFGRQCVSSVTSVEKGLEILHKVLPYDDRLLPDYHTDIYELIDAVETSYISSAGFPYCVSKGKCVDVMLDGVLPLVVEAYCSKDGPNKLYKEQPELFLCQLKNKDDRYEDATEKTRPYLSLPWHFQTLFSILCQPFSKALLLFHENPKCRNAYGFSYANGGGEKLLEFAKATPKNGVRYCVYGDDVDLYRRDANGTLYRYCPDFKQMDGSVDEITVATVVSYIYGSYLLKYGESVFWKNICKEWINFATKPEFVMDSSEVFQKKSNDGLMTGVVGTTLFDTAKAIFAYEHFIEVASVRPSMWEEENAKKFFLEHHGLVVKDGTWTCEVVNENPGPGEFVTEQKFLGMRLRCSDNDGERLIHPDLHYEEWMKMLFAPKHLDQSGKSVMVQHRYLFDRLRGYLTTGGSFNERFRLVCNTMLDYISPVAMVMAVQANGGKGALPELINVVGADFEFSSSMGWPTEEWVRNLYAPQDQKKDLPMPPIYVCGEEAFTEGRKRPALMPKTAAVVDVVVAGQVATSSVIKLPEPEPPVVKDIAPLVGVAEAAERSPDLKPNKRSKVLDIDTRIGEMKNRKYVPGLSEQIKTVMKTVEIPWIKDVVELLSIFAGGKVKTEFVKGELEFARQKYKTTDMVTEQIAMNSLLDNLGSVAETSDVLSVLAHPMHTLESLSEKLHQKPGVVRSEARKLGYFVFGPETNQVVSKVPVAPVLPDYRRDIERQKEANQKQLSALTTKIREQPVGKSTTLLVSKKREVAKTVERAKAKPALLPPKLKTLGSVFKFQKVPDITLNELQIETDFLRVQGIARHILRSNRIYYTVEKYKHEETGKMKVVYLHKGKEIFSSEEQPKAALYQFYLLVKDTYLSQMYSSLAHSEAVKEGVTDWAELQEREGDALVNVYYFKGHPLLMQYKDLPLRLVGTHPSLTSSGGLVHWHDGPQAQVLAMRGRPLQTAERLSRLLGGKVEGLKESFNNFSLKYPDLAETFEVLNSNPSNIHKLPVDVNNRNKRAEKRRGSTKSRGQGGGGRVKDPEKEEKQLPANTETQAGTSNQDGVSRPQKSDSNGWVRLSREHLRVNNRQDRVSEKRDQPKPSVLARNENSGGGKAMAALPTKISRGRSN